MCSSDLSVARGRSEGFVQEIVVGVGLRRLVLGFAAVVCAARWWRIWRWVAGGGRCWVCRRVRLRHARSSSKIPSAAAGDSRLQLCRSSLAQDLWWPASFFPDVGVGVKLEYQVCWLFCSDLQFFAALSFAVQGLYGVRLLRHLRTLLC